MNYKKLEDMQYHCENYCGGYEEIDYLEKLERISNRIFHYKKQKITNKELLEDIGVGSSKCPFHRNGDTIDGLCFTEKDNDDTQMQQCYRCWKNFLEVTDEEEDKYYDGIQEKT